jgi:hypothetical protein
MIAKDSFQTRPLLAVKDRPYRTNVAGAACRTKLKVTGLALGRGAIIFHRSNFLHRNQYLLATSFKYAFMNSSSSPSITA